MADKDVSMMTPDELTIFASTCRTEAGLRTRLFLSSKLESDRLYADLYICLAKLAERIVDKEKKAKWVPEPLPPGYKAHLPDDMERI